ncbi:hypothetical protein ACGFJ7_35705 [Actinoplanes sp. NPDC048988]|uniref:3-dehydroquinate synthase family protein n=1 Tax=Actinoplanes sp. NPDC048988 TaxID=3363901 RepID=UPI0037183700
MPDGDTDDGGSPSRTSPSAVLIDSGRWFTDQILPFGEPGCRFVVALGLWQEFSDALSSLAPDRLFAVIDRNAPDVGVKLALSALAAVAPVTAVRIEPAEQSKTLATVDALARQAVDARATRRSCVVAIGGGLVGNLAGLLAALLYRGIRLVHLPTTLLAASDATLSQKQAVNLGAAKNTIGAYHPPALVWADVGFLQDLPVVQVRSALCEAAKNVLALDPRQLPALRMIAGAAGRHTAAQLAQLIDICVQIKTSVLIGDPRESRRALALEYGHTVGHAVEMVACGRVPHGYAVALGMLTAAEVAARCGILAAASVAAHTDLLASIGVPLRAPRELRTDQIVRLVRRDNKRGLIPVAENTCAMVLLSALGSPATTGDIPLVAVHERLLHDALSATVVNHS